MVSLEPGLHPCPQPAGPASLPGTAGLVQRVLKDALATREHP